jgi:hypothetical protein
VVLDCQSSLMPCRDRYQRHHPDRPYYPSLRLRLKPISAATFSKGRQHQPIAATKRIAISPMICPGTALSRVWRPLLLAVIIH